MSSSTLKEVLAFFANFFFVWGLISIFLDLPPTNLFADCDGLLSIDDLALSTNLKCFIILSWATDWEWYLVALGEKTVLFFVRWPFTDVQLHAMTS